jgi:hypothetical protein
MRDARDATSRSRLKEVITLTDAAPVVTALVSRAEVAAALPGPCALVFSISSVVGAPSGDSHGWPDLIKVPVSEALVAQAELWRGGLRG